MAVSYTFAGVISRMDKYIHILIWRKLKLQREKCSAGGDEEHPRPLLHVSSPTHITFNGSSWRTEKDMTWKQR